MAFTEEQKKEIASIIAAAIPEAIKPLLDESKEEFGKMANGAATRAVDKVMKDVKGKLDGVPTGDALAELVKTQIEAVKGELGKVQATPASGNGEPKKPDTEFLKLQEQMANLLKERERERAEFKATQERIARDEEARALTDELRKHVRPELVDAAALLLNVKQKAIVRDEKGNIVYRAQRKDYEENLTVSDGVAEWIKSEQGKVFLPAKEVGGGGDKNGGKAPTSGSADSSKNVFLDGLRQ